MFLHILQELCPFDADKRINFHSKFNENSISFSPYSVNVVTNCEFLFAIKLSSHFFLQGSNIYKLYSNLFFFPLLLLDLVPFSNVREITLIKIDLVPFLCLRETALIKKNGIQMYNFRIKSGIYTRSMHIPCPIAHFHNSKDTDILTHIKCT